MRVGGVAVGVMLAIGAAVAVAATGPMGARVKDNLYATKLVSPSEGWAVGAFGTIAHTTDAGRTWQPQVSHTTEPLFSVDFVDPKNGWVVGRSGVILHTTDGGETWQAQNGRTDKHLLSVDFVDPQTGYAVGDWGTILVTHDGGKTWESRSLDRDLILNDVFMLDTSRGWIVGETGVLYVTEDGGQTWTERPNEIGKTLYGVFFTDAQHGWAVGLDGLILRTEDGGSTWEVQHGSTEVGALEQVQFSQSVDNPSLYAVKIIGDHGFAVGETGAIFVSNDGGRTWARQVMPENWGMSWLRDISVVPGLEGTIVGADGRVVRIDKGRVDLTTEE